MTQIKLTYSTMSSSSSSSSSSSPFGFPPAKGISWRKAPALDPEDFAGWEMMFKAYVGYAEWELFRESEPRVTQEQTTPWWNQMDRPQRR